MQRGLIQFLAGLAVCTFAGCSASRTSNTARTSIEQLLISNAVDQALDKVAFSTFAGYRVRVEDKYVDCVDKSYVIASVRHRLLNAGAQLVETADDADVVIELRSGVVGTTGSESFIGFPEVTLPGMLTLPEVRIAERKRQQGTAKIGIVAYDPKTRQILGNGGVTLASSDDNNWYMVGIGPFQSGSLSKEVTRSTTGPAAQVRQQLPPTVAFEMPYPAAGEQFASEKAPASAVDQASHDKPARPVWTEP